MRAIVAQRFGDAGVLELAEIPRPAPQPGHVLVRLAYAGVNYADIYMRRGLYRRGHTYGVEPPFTPGLEGAGTVAALGEGVDGLPLGARVAFCLGARTYAEIAVVPAWRLVVVPSDVELAEAAAIMLQGATAHYLTHSLRALERGDWCLVHAAAGGVGQLIVQLAKRRGARVIATVGDRDKAEIARELGADHVVLYRDTPFAEEVRRITDGRGVDIVYDGVGVATIVESLRSLRMRGVCVLFGAASGPVESISPMDLAEAGSVFLTRPHLAHYMRDRAEVEGRANDLFAALRNGLRVAIHDVLPLNEAARAHRLLESRQTRGKLLLGIGTSTPGGDRAQQAREE